MPLAFESLSHGTIAFGFFNIESDMLLCDRYFFFADEFCAQIELIAGHVEEPEYQAIWRVHTIEGPEKIGDLMGAIHGVRFTGFIGELYRHFPFPEQPGDFKQNPAGAQTQALVTDIVSTYARHEEIQIVVDNNRLETAFGGYRFNRNQFQQLLKYVWRGGYPRWKDGIRPAYVLDLKRKILAHPKGIFKNIDFGD